jgi:hypothetical protein
MASADQLSSPWRGRALVSTEGPSEEIRARRGGRWHAGPVVGRSSAITPSWWQTFEALHSAVTVDELWAVLLAWHGIRSSTMWEEPFAVFMRFHRNDPTDAVVTAALLLTDHRWRTASHHLVQQIGDAGVLTEDDLEALADAFLAQRFDIEVVHARRRATRRGRRSNDPPVSTVSRPIWPPARRWAAGQVVRRHPARWRELLLCAEELPAGDGAAVAAGVMDSAGHIPAAEARQAVVAGLNAGSGTVRLAALPALAALDGAHAALARARSDASAKVRGWSPRNDGLQLEISVGSPARIPQKDRDQQSLF